MLSQEFIGAATGWRRIKLIKPCHLPIPHHRQTVGRMLSANSSPLRWTLETTFISPFPPSVFPPRASLPPPLSADWSLWRRGKKYDVTDAVLIPLWNGKIGRSLWCGRWVQLQLGGFLSWCQRSAGWRLGGSYKSMEGAWRLCGSADKGESVRRG